MWEGIKVTSQSYNGVYYSRKNVIIVFMCIAIGFFAFGFAVGSLLEQYLATDIVLEGDKELVFDYVIDPNNVAWSVEETYPHGEQDEAIALDITDPYYVVDPNGWVDFTDPQYTSVDIVLDHSDWALTMSPLSGGELSLSFGDNGLEITGDADMNEAAKVFFYNHLQSMANDYIKSRLKDRNYIQD